MRHTRPEPPPYWSVCLLLAALFAPPAPAIAAGAIVLSSGEPGGGYWLAAARLQSVAAGMDLAVENLASSGSMDNLERLMDPDNPVSLVFAQADALQHYLNDRPAARKSIDILETLGQECVFLLARADSGIETDEDLQDRAQGLTLSIPGARSGVAITYAYMASQLPELAAIAVRYGDTGAAATELAAGTGDIDAVMVVHRPRAHSPPVARAIAEPDHLRFVALTDNRLTRQLPGERRVYRETRLALPGLSEPVHTICVRGLLLGHKIKLDLRQRNQLTDLVNYHWMRVYSTE